jgi:hypothetical protein
MFAMNAAENVESAPIFETEAPFIDRRRPGRIEEISTHLLPLFREENYLAGPGPDLRPFSGIVIGVLLSIPMWYVLAGSMLVLFG